MDPEQLQQLNRVEEPRVPHLSRQRKFFSQFSILPGPHPAIRPNRNSTNTIVTVGGDGSSTPKNVLLQNNKTFSVKKFRMRSLLWVKPAGVAETSLSSTIAQVIYDPLIGMKNKNSMNTSRVGQLA